VISQNAGWAGSEGTFREHPRNTPPPPMADLRDTPEEIRRELERVALGQPNGGRGQLAKVTALRTLERWSRPAREEGPVDDDGRWHPGPSEWWDLDRHDSDDVRERWREAVERRAR
jgi:hypothetical protein